jgi:tetratricopeptide (TPR) repeat protein
MTSASKIFFIIIIICFAKMSLYAQDSFENQFNFAKKLFDEENYFDAVTEFKRLLFFDESKAYKYEANFLIGLSYKNGAKFSEAIEYFTKAELSSKVSKEIFDSRLEIIKLNILRRTTSRALTLLDSLDGDPRLSNQKDEINYWRGWAYIFDDDWKKASSTFKEVQEGNFLSEFCDSIANDHYNPQLAQILSIIPGAGQFYTGEYVSGLISIGWNVLWGYLTINAFVEDRIFDGVIIGTLLWWRFYSGNIQNAEKFAVEKNLQITNSALHFLKTNYSGNKP